MEQAAAELRFEDANVYKQRVQLLERHYAKSLVVSASIDELDVFSMVEEGGDAFCNFMRVRGGCIVQSFSMELRSRIEESPEQFLGTFMAEMVSRFGELSKEVLVPFMPEGDFGGRNVHIPLKGEKAALMELSRRNAAAMKVDKAKQEEHLHPEEHQQKLVAVLQKDLGMDTPPRHMECFDNSNIQGTNPVASCVVFRDCKPSKKEYRHFKIKTVVGANDFASMKEVLNRRYSRMLAEGEPLPDLIVVDGGKGQLHSALEALAELGIDDRIKIVGLAKRMEEIIVPDDPHPLFLDRNSSSLKVMMHIRDEAHRFGITFHRSLRSKGQIHSELLDIEGVGEATEAKLIRRFRSVARVKKASLDELTAAVGKKQAQIIYQHFNNTLL